MGPQEVIYELQQATLLRAAYSERQLYELMVDFWTNHFNIYIGKDSDKWMKTVDDREVIRANALGKFRDMLTASAKSPAMLEYLDNRVSVKGKPNENYAREIMELHTLGVDGGYTYADIQNVARAFTGWTLLPPRRPGDTAGEYLFNARQHDTDEKTVLGVTIPKGGNESDGLKVIEILANHPSTAKFVSKKLVRRFVSDNPPDALVQSVAATYQKTDGDIRQMMGVILHSDEFKNSYGQKVRRPLEFVAASMRALDVKVDAKNSEILRGVMVLLGQPLFQWATPDGYPDYAGAWINTERAAGPLEHRAQPDAGRRARDQRRREDADDPGRPEDRGPGRGLLDRSPAQPRDGPRRPRQSDCLPDRRRRELYAHRSDPENQTSRQRRADPRLAGLSISLIWRMTWLTKFPAATCSRPPVCSRSAR